MAKEPMSALSTVTESEHFYMEEIHIINRGLYSLFRYSEYNIWKYYLNAFVIHGIP